MSPTLYINIENRNHIISGVQLADLLGHPTKMWALKHYGLIDDELAPFAKRLMNIVEQKFNRQMYTDKLEGYGIVLYPK